MQVSDASKNFPSYLGNISNPFFSDSNGNINTSMHYYFAFLGQNINNCDNLTVLYQRNPNSRTARERDPRNCAKLNATPNTYFQGALVKVWNQGTFHFIGTRNNNFSNRSQKLKVTVGQCTQNCGTSNSLSGGAIAGIVIGSAAACGALGFLFYKFGGASTLRSRFGSRAKLLTKKTI